MYDNIRQLRKLVLEEMKSEFGGVLTIEHFMLAEMRVQSAIMAKVDAVAMKKEQVKWKEQT